MALDCVWFDYIHGNTTCGAYLRKEGTYGMGGAEKGHGEVVQGNILTSV